MFFRNPLRPIPYLTINPCSPASKKPIPVVIPLDQRGKKEVMMQKVNVSDCKRKMDKMVRSVKLPYVRSSRSLHKDQVAGNTVPMSLGR
jgi:hypothetical protein